VHRDITERNQAEEKIKEAAREWQMTFDSITDFIFIQDKELKFIKVNKAFADALKVKPEELIGKKCYHLLHKSDKPWPNCPALQTLNDKKSHTVEVIDPNIGVPLLISTSPISNDKGEVIAIVHYAHNITERKNAEDALAKAYAESEDKVRERTKELQERLDELERFRKATVEREFRMKELRDEIDRLKQEKAK